MTAPQTYAGFRYIDRDTGKPFTEISLLLTRAAVAREAGGRSYAVFSADGEAIFGFVAGDGGGRVDTTLPTVVKNPNYSRSP